MQIVYKKTEDNKIVDWSSKEGDNGCNIPVLISDAELVRFRFKKEEYSI